MVLRRLSENLRGQNWTVITIEFVLVVLGVFLGILAANWNQERQARNETAVLLSQLAAELRAVDAGLRTVGEYYATTRKFAETAQAGWRGHPAVSDEEFVIAAYQASQITTVTNNSAVWAEIFGAADLHNIEDPAIRNNLARFMTFDFNLISLGSVSTPYREEVRKAIPDNIQSAIRRHCGDRPSREGLTFTLPEHCTIDIPDTEAAATAAELRERPELANELRWHLAAVANQLLNVETLKRISADLRAELEES